MSLLFTEENVADFHFGVCACVCEGEGERETEKEYVSCMSVCATLFFTGLFITINYKCTITEKKKFSMVKQVTLTSMTSQ